jgi:hypothetical protein
MTHSAVAHLIEIEGIAIHLVRKPVKGLRISIHPPHGRVRVSAPLRLDEAFIRQAVAGRADWIRRKQAALAARPIEPPIDEVWAREYLRTQIPNLQARWEPHIGVTASEVRIRRMKTRWGSCNVRTRRIWLSLVLAKKSPACLEYVFVHELAHLIERGHGKRFKQLMDGFLPGWRAHRAELNRLPKGKLAAAGD